VRFSEKLLEKAGLTVETLDLSEVFGRITALADDDNRVSSKIDSIRTYGKANQIPPDAIRKVAKLGVVMDEWIVTNNYAGTAVQCWTSLEEYFGVVPCVLMSMLSDNLMPSACETDIAGAIAMYALSLASGKPSALVDWNNNYSDDPDKGVIFHCSNLPKDLLIETESDAQAAGMDYQAIIAGTVGKENTYGTVVGRVPPPLSAASAAAHPKVAANHSAWKLSMGCW